MSRPLSDIRVRRPTAASLALLLALGGCSSGTPTGQEAARADAERQGWDDPSLVGAAPALNATTASSVASMPSASVPTAAAPSTAPSQPPPASGARAEDFANTSFPPPAATPMHTRTQKPGDGVWQPLEELASEAKPPIYVTTIHPHKIKGFVYLTALALDRQAIDLTLVAGKLEPKSDKLPDEQRPAVVPSSAYADLLMVLNGGFKTRHGNYGMWLDGVALVPPKDAACTVAQYRDGRLRVRSWAQVSADLPQISTYRQTPPCLVEQGERNAALPTEFRTRLWGAAQGGARDIRRSALGVDRSGRTLFFVVGDWITAGELADAMIALGAYDAAQLDINWSYTRAFTFTRSAGAADPPKVARSLVPKLKFSRDRYIQKRSQRDFYYVTRRR